MKTCKIFKCGGINGFDGWEWISNKVDSYPNCFVKIQTMIAFALGILEVFVDGKILMKK